MKDLSFLAEGTGLFCDMAFCEENTLTGLSFSDRITVAPESPQRMFVPERDFLAANDIKVTMLVTAANPGPELHVARKH